VSLLLAALALTALATQAPAGRPVSAAPPSHQQPQPDATLTRFESVEPHMGTLVQVIVYVVGEDQAREAFRVAFDRIRELDATLSDYKEHSELNEIVRNAVGRAVPVGDDLLAVLTKAQELAQASGGAFDVTQGPVIRLWRDARKTGRIPEANAVREASAHTGFRKMHVDAARRTVMFDMPGMALDVGGLAKGYAASQAIAALTRCGVRSAMVAVSGDLAFSEAPPGQRGWRVGIEGGAGDGSQPSVLELTNAAVSTAGSREQHLDAGGRRYSHIVDPASGMGLTDDITVTVIARDGIDADGLDTAVSVLGATRGLALIASHPDAAALIIRRSGKETIVLRSPRFAGLATIRP
jgi:thiamine biosynthesis lipoprotein